MNIKDAADFIINNPDDLYRLDDTYLEALCFIFDTVLWEKAGLLRPDDEEGEENAVHQEE